MKEIYQSNLIIGIMQWISIQKMKHSKWFELILKLCESRKFKGMTLNLIFFLNILRNKQTVLIYIALLQCTCQIYTNTAVFKIYKMIIIRYPRGTLFTSDISIILSVTNG